MTIFNSANQVVRRGCSHAVLADYQTHCTANPELCFNCKGNGCNKITDANDYQTCLFCDGSNRYDCIFNPSEISNTRKCAEGCLTALYERKSNPLVQDLIRACFEDMELDDKDECENDPNCIKCTTDNCNTALLPAAERLSCYHCNGADDCLNPKAQSCLGYMSADQCYIYYDKNTQRPSRMGCKSEFLSSQILEEIKQFYICDGDDCNSESSISFPTAKQCVVCDSSVNPNCATTPANVETVETCSGPHTDCYSRIKGRQFLLNDCCWFLICFVNYRWPHSKRLHQQLEQ